MDNEMMGGWGGDGNPPPPPPRWGDGGGGTDGDRDYLERTKQKNPNPPLPPRDDRQKDRSLLPYRFLVFILHGLRTITPPRPGKFMDLYI